MVAESVAGATEPQISRRGEGLEVSYIHIKEYSHELATMMSAGVLTLRMAEVQEKLSHADTIIAATPRHSLVLESAMQPLFIFLRANVMTAGVFAATEDLGGFEGKTERSEAARSLESRINRAAAGLAAAICSSKAVAGGFLPNDRYHHTLGEDGGEVADFASLLRGHDGS